MATGTHPPPSQIIPITLIPKITVQTISPLDKPPDPSSHNRTHVRYQRPPDRQNQQQKSESRPHSPTSSARRPTTAERIIDFFLDVMEDRIDGAELCHRMDAAKQLEKHKSKAAARFLAKYRGVSCGHSINAQAPTAADPCSGEDEEPGGRDPERPGHPFREDLPHCALCG